jgi:hypothetical protein
VSRVSEALEGGLLRDTQGHAYPAPAPAVGAGLGHGVPQRPLAVGDLDHGSGDGAEVAGVVHLDGGGVETIQPGLGFGRRSLELFVGSGRGHHLNSS